MAASSLPDNVCWLSDINGLYSVKSAYITWLTEGEGVTHMVGWNDVWHAPVIPKVKHFLWRIFSKSLPTKSVLFRRHMLGNDLCPLCNMEEETVEHALIRCQEVRQIWLKLDECYGIKTGLSASWDDSVRGWKQSDEDKHQMALTMAWILW